MDPITNPYAPGAGQRPPALTGRDNELAAVEVLIERAAAGRPERSIVLTGLRGVGKTVLLNESRAPAEERGWVVAKLEVSDDRSLQAGIVQGLYPALRRRVRSGLGDRFRAALRAFRSFSLRAAPDGSFSLGVDVDPARGRADSGDFELDLAELLTDIAEAVEAREGVLLLIDELQDAETSDLAALAGALHETTQAQLPVAVIAAGLPSLPGILAEARSYTERLFAYRRIAALGPDAAARALCEPADQQGVTWAPEAVEHVLERSAGYPFFLQQFGKTTWDLSSGSTIRGSDAEAGVATAERTELDIGFYGSRWERATPLEREYMRAMAAVAGDDPASTGDVARELNRRPQALSPTRAQLIHKGLVYAPEHGQVAFTVPGMAGFIARQHE